MNRSAKINVAVIGLGYMGQNHTRILFGMENVSLVAVCDIDEGKTNKIASQYKVKPYKDFKAMIQKEKLDAVFICLPAIFHFNSAMIAIKSKIAVFVEKPITTDIKQADQLIKASRLYKVPLMVGHIERFNPVVNEINNRIKSQEIGKVFKIHTSRFSPPGGRVNDVSVILDLATHDIDIIKYLIDQPIIRIYAETEAFTHKKADLMSALLRFKNGVIGVVEVSWLHPTKVRHLSVVGERGSYEADYLTQELSFYRQNNKMSKGYESPSQFNSADIIKIAFKAQEPLLVELQAFINALMHRKKMPVTGEEGREALLIAEKISQSGTLHKIIK